MASSQTRKGSGTYLIKPISAGTIHMPLSLDTAQLRDALLQTLEVRRGIEAEASMVAARRRTAADLGTIEEKLVEMERVHLATGTSGPEDLAFHLAVYDATHNPLFRQLLGQMREAFERFWDHPFDRQDFARALVPVPPRAVRRDRRWRRRAGARQDAENPRDRRRGYRGNVEMTRPLISSTRHR